MQETLRVHPAIIEIVRFASEDDIIPLSKPVVGISGKVYNQLAIPKGTVVAVSTFGPNLWAIPDLLVSLRPLIWHDPVGTEKYGGQMPTTGVQNDGLKHPGILNHQLGCMGTCAQCNFIT